MSWYISRDSKFVLGPISFWQCKWASRWRKLYWVVGCCVNRQLRTGYKWLPQNWIHARNTCRPILLKVESSKSTPFSTPDKALQALQVVLTQKPLPPVRRCVHQSRESCCSGDFMQYVTGHAFLAIAQFWRWSRNWVCWSRGRKQIAFRWS